MPHVVVGISRLSKKAVVEGGEFYPWGFKAEPAGVPSLARGRRGPSQPLVRFEPASTERDLTSLLHGLMFSLA